MLRVPIWGVAALIAGIMSVTSVARAQNVPFSTDTTGGYARLLMEFPSPPEYEARIENGVLVIQFQSPFDIDVALLSRSLPRYVSLVRQDPNRRSLRLALKRNFRLHTSEAENQVAVDLVPYGFPGDPPSLDPQSELDNQQQAIVIEDGDFGPIEIRPLGVRVGRQKEFSRIVFEWPKRVAYDAKLENGLVTLRFAKAADPNIVGLRVDPPQFVKTADKSIKANTLTVTIEINADAGMRHYREDDHVVVDVLSPKLTLRRNDAQALTGKSDIPQDGPVNLTANLRRGEAEPVFSEAAAEKTEKIEVASNEPTEDADELAEAASSVGVEWGQDQADEVTDAEMQSSLVTPGEDETKVVGAVMESDVPPADETSLPQETNEPAADADSGATPQIDPDANFAAYEKDGNLHVLMRWDHEVPIAAFRRGQYVWIIAEDTSPLDGVMRLDQDFRQYVSSVTSTVDRTIRIVRLKVADRLLMTAKAEDNSWTIILGETIAEPTAPLNLTRAADGLGRSRVLVPYDGFGDIHWLTDPEVGDSLAVITATGPAHGLVTAQRFIEFIALSSAHGLIIQAISDDVFVRRVGAGVEIGRDLGLTLSGNGTTEQLVKRTPLGAVADPTFVDFKAWRKGSEDEYIKRANELNFNVIRSPEVNVDYGPSVGRMILARFYLAHDMAHEAIGVLEELAEEDETMSLDPSFAMLWGVAQYMSRRYEDAVDAFKAAPLESSMNAALWRGAALNQLGNHAGARRYLEQGEAAISRYPPDWQARFHIDAAEAWLKANDVARVQRHLDALPTSEIGDKLLAEAEFVRGRMLEAMNKEGEALQHYQRVILRGSERSVVQATLAKTLLLYRMGELPDEEVIERLEVLRFQWRGDDLELAMLHELGRVYVDSGDYRQGLSIMRQAVTNYPESQVAGEINESMSDVFKKLFLEESIANIPPVQALALYNDFKDLTPIGRDGDDMIRRLADRLVAFDLLEQAAELLEHQTHQRLRGVARAQVATRLAMIYLMDHKPSKALQAIRSTRQTRLPKSVTHARRLLEARALAEIEQFDHALELINGDDDPEADRLREDIYWESEDWPMAAEKIEVRLGDRWRTPCAMGNEERSDVMRAAVAFALAEDDRGLERLRRKFGEKMSQSPDADGFEIITEEINTEGVEFRELASHIASTDTLEAFMEQLRNRLKVSDAGTPETSVN